MKPARLLTLVVLLVAIGLGVIFGFARKSALFTVQAVSLEKKQDHSLISDEALIERAKVPVGKMSLLDLDLKQIEARLKEEKWIKNVVVRRQLPQTLVLEIEFRTPVALTRLDSKRAGIIDEDGMMFSETKTPGNFDLPWLSASLLKNSERFAEAMSILKTWNQTAGKSGEVASLKWTLEKGFQAWITYGQKRVRADLGEEQIDFAWSQKLALFRKTIDYLSESGRPARVISAQSQKKMVVKTTLDS